MHRRVSIFTCLLVVIGVTSYQMVVPDALVTSVGTMMIILGTYMNQEDPAMRELSRYHEEMVMGFATLIENRDDNIGGHVKRTTRYAALPAEEITEIYLQRITYTICSWRHRCMMWEKLPYRMPFFRSRES